MAARVVRVAGWLAALHALRKSKAFRGAFATYWSLELARVAAAEAMRRMAIGNRLVWAVDQQVGDADMPEEDVGRVVHGGPFVVKVALEVKARMKGTPEDTKLNRDNAWAIGRSVMREWTGDSHRTQHYMRDLPWVVEAVFTPTQIEQEARAAGNSLPVRWRKWRSRAPFLLSLFV